MGSRRESSVWSYRGLQVSETRNESRRRCTVVSGSIAAISRSASDEEGPGQRFATAAMELRQRTYTRDSVAAVRWAQTIGGWPKCVG